MEYICASLVILLVVGTSGLVILTILKASQDKSKNSNSSLNEINRIADEALSKMRQESEHYLKEVRNNLQGE